MPVTLPLHQPAKVAWRTLDISGKREDTHLFFLPHGDQHISEFLRAIIGIAAGR
jgi:hypothetical protein